MSSIVPALSRRSLLAGLMATAATPVLAQWDPLPVVPKQAPIGVAPPRTTQERSTISTAREPTFERDTYVNTERALRDYEGIAARGGWPTVPTRVAPGATGPSVSALRVRLVATGDLHPAALSGEVFDPAVEDGLRRFQARHGLTNTGAVGPLTHRALNVTVSQRIAQLRASLGRLAITDFTFPQRYVAVNIPAAAVEAIDGSNVTQRYAAVVGRPDRQSPELVTRLTVVNLNPTWTVPLSIVRKDIIPKVIKDPGYLARMNMRVLDGAGREIDPYAIAWAPGMTVNFTIRQDPGPENALGQTRLDMPNPHSVFMHDTPKKDLFSQDMRYASSGCVRVEDVRDLAAWVLAGTPGGSRNDIEAGIASGQRMDIRAARPVAVIWMYMTGWGTRDGTVHFREDIYKQDDDTPEKPLVVANQRAIGASATGMGSAPRTIAVSAHAIDER
jgi:murein L,D-transpeptidase YcbB/YkuD